MNKVRPGCVVYIRMNYVINVSQNGKHLFRTAEDSVSYYELPRVVRELVKRFPKSEGFAISVTRWQNSGTEMTMKEIEAIR